MQIFGIGTIILTLNYHFLWHVRLPTPTSFQLVFCLCSPCMASQNHVTLHSYFTTSRVPPLRFFCSFSIELRPNFPRRTIQCVSMNAASLSSDAHTSPAQLAIVDSVSAARLFHSVLLFQLRQPTFINIPIPTRFRAILLELNGCRRPIRGLFRFPVMFTS